MLTETRVRTAKATEKAYKLYDERGLYLIVRPDGARWWRLKYRIAGREKLISLGTYPDTPLKRARERRDEARRLVADGIDPSLKRQAERAAQADTLTAVAREWLAVHAGSVTAGTLARDRHRLERYVLPYLGSRPVAAIGAQDLLGVLRRIEARGTLETASRTREVCGRVLRYAVQTGRAEHDVSAALRGALRTVPPRSYAAITDPAKAAELLREIDGYRGQPTTEAALRLAPYVFSRPGELRAAKWSEIDLDGAEWRIPAERMKMREQHIVPLSRQAVAILRGLHAITGPDGYVFPALHTSLRPISENTLNVALRRLGYGKDEMTSHGFRSMASTLLNEQGYPPDLIELQLAHAERNKVRAAYNRAQRLDERRRMMQEWADYLDRLRAAMP